MAQSEAVADTPEGIVYDLMVQRMARQQSVLSGLRTRTSTLLAAASLVTAFLGGQAISPGGALEWSSWLAVAFFLGVGGAALAILWPWKFRFDLSATILIEDYIEGDEPKSVSALQRFLATSIEQRARENQVTIDRLFWVFRLGLVLLVVEVVFWLAALGGR